MHFKSDKATIFRRAGIAQHVSIIVFAVGMVVAVAAVWAGQGELQNRLGGTAGVLLAPSVVTILGAMMVRSDNR